MTAVFFRRVGEILCLLGRKIGFPTGLFFFVFIGLVFNGLRLHMLPESKSGKDEIIFATSISSFKHNQFASTEYFSCQDRELVVNSLENCSCAVSGFTPNIFTEVSQMQCNVREGQNVHTTDDSEGSKCSVPKLSDTVSVCAHARQPKETEVPSSSCHKTSKDESQKSVVKKADISAICKGEVNGGLLRRSLNKLSTWCSSVKTYVSGGGSWDQMKWSHPQFFSTYVFSLKYFISLLTLLVVLVGMMFGLMERRPGIGFQVAIIVSILGFILKYINDTPPTIFQYDFATLIYELALFFMFLALMLEHIQRELSYLFAGTAYACVHLAFLNYTFICISPDYAFVYIAVLLFFVLFAVVSGLLQIELIE